MRAIFALLFVLSIACGDGSAGPPLANGAYVVEGSATLTTNHETIREVEAHARFVLYVEGDQPSYFRDESFGDEFGRLYDLSFEADSELSEPVALSAAVGICSVRIRRDGCADFDFEGCVRLDLRTDQGHALTGRWSACPTDEVAVRRLAVVGALEPTAITPDGAARLTANYRLDPSADAIEVRVNGAVREVSWTPGADADSADVELGPVPPNAELTITHVGTRAGVDFDHVAPFLTTADADLSLATLVEGSLDARGEQAVALVDDELEVRRTTSPPHPSFAFALSLGEVPDGASALALATSSTSFGSSPVRTFLVRADGSFETDQPATAISIPVPDGSGPTWLVVAHAGTYAPDGAFGGRFAISAVVWE